MAEQRQKYMIPNLMTHRKIYGISRKQMAAAIGVGYETVKRWEIGMNYMTKEHYDMVKELLCIS